MFCKNCFKKISSRSHFCKYCGAPVEQKREKKEPVKEESPPVQGPPPALPKKKEYSFKLRSERDKEFPIPPKYIGIAIVVILLILMVSVFVKSSIFQTPESMSYTDYVGIWQQSASEDVEEEGGVRLEVHSVSGGTMIISMGFYDGGAAYNGIEVNNVGAVIEDGAAYYTFSNDGYGNSGNGVLTFNGRDIEWKSVINKEEPVYYTVIKVKNAVTEETAQQQTEESTEETSENRTEGEYVLPDSSTAYLTEDDLEGMTPEELRIARNEIMARHGRKFNDPALAAYFESKDWYHGTIDPETFDNETVNELNEFEVQNIALIQSKE